MLISLRTIHGRRPKFCRIKTNLKQPRTAIKSWRRIPNDFHNYFTNYEERITFLNKAKTIWAMRREEGRKINFKKAKFCFSQNFRERRHSRNIGISKNRTSEKFCFLNYFVNYSTRGNPKSLEQYWGQLEQPGRHLRILNFEKRGRRLTGADEDDWLWNCCFF